MRDILFRAKRRDTGEWVYGDVIQNAHTVKIREHEAEINRIAKSYEIDSDTLGQYTGLTDKNGKKIFEGDIVSGTAYSNTSIGVIGWIPDIASFGIEYKSQHRAAWENASILKLLAHRKNSEFVAEVIGNVFDDPELIGGESDD